MAAGNWKDWAQGEIVTEAGFQDIQDSIVFIYSNDSAANSALTNKVEGTSYYNTTDDELKIWDGSAWVAVGGGSITLLSSATASSSADLTFDNFVDEATYSEYIFIMRNIIPQTDNTTLRYVYRSSTPSDITGTYYSAGAYYYGDGAFSGFESNLSDTNFGKISDLGNASLETFSGKFSFYYGAGSYSSAILGKFFRHNPFANVQGQEYGGFLKASDSIAGIKFYMASGNISSGTISVYGVKKV